MNIVVTWARIGPYHAARLRGLMQVAGVEAAVTGLEVASRDHYEWTELGGDGPRRVTLFPGCTYQSVSGARIGIEMARALGRLRPDVVAVNGWSVPEAVAAIGWCARNSVPCVLMSETKEDDGEGARPWFKESVKTWIVRRCGAALVGGRRQAEYLERLGFPGDRIFLGYDAVDNTWFEEGSRRARESADTLRHEMGLPERYFFACTRFLARKNIDGLLRAYGLYRGLCGDSPWGLVISGSGEEGERLRGLEGELGVEGVVWLGFVQYDELPACYGLASAFIHPARAEPWGLVVNEAAACGLPLIVGGTVGSAYELVCDGDNGFLVDARSDEDLCAKMLAVAGASDFERERMGARSREIVAEWSPRRFGEGLLAAARAAASMESDGGWGAR